MNGRVLAPNKFGLSLPFYLLQQQQPTDYCVIRQFGIEMMGSIQSKEDTILYHGNFIHPNKDHAGVEVLLQTAVVVVSGRITVIKPLSVDDVPKFETEHHIDRVVLFSSSTFVIPGFIDAHIHASQYPNSGLGLEQPLLEWLKEYTYPTEAQFSDVTFAKDVYEKLVARTLSNGTTMASYFATIHKDATLQLCDIVERMGQKANVGKVSMDINSPDYYIESTSEAIAEARSFVEEALAQKYTNVTPCITPRFAVSCTRELMQALGKLASDYKLPIQTHLSESIPEIEFVKKIHGVDSYLQLYEDCGLATKDTVFAHCVYSTGPEMQSLKRLQCGVSHCPISNTNILSGCFRAREFMQQDLRVGLGTDVSGGHLPSILQLIQRAIDVSKFLQIQNGGPGAKPHHLSVDEAFCLATIGGAKALNQETNMGSFEVGKCFDALLVDPGVKGSPFQQFSKDSLVDVFHKFIMLGDDRNIIQVFVNGHCVVNKICSQ